MNSLRISSMGTKRRAGLIALLAVLVLVSCVANLAFGAVSIPPACPGCVAVCWRGRPWPARGLSSRGC